MKSDQIQNALFYAKKYNFKIFPAIWNKKTKQHTGLCKWSTESSSDPNVIKAWGNIHPANAYFCVNLRQSGLTVIDVDTKANKPGLKTLTGLEIEYGDLPKTLKIKTPNNGLHFYMLGEAQFGANRLGDGVDIPVMVPLPNSTTGKGSYTILNDLPILPLPSWVTDLAGIIPEASENKDKSLIELDQEHNIEKAIQLLTQAEPAIEGEGGNDRTYKVICRVRDCGISGDVCFELISKHYNDRCDPPWGNTELEQLISHAYTYAKSAPGANDPSQDFEPLIPSNLIQFASLNELATNTDPPAWLVKNYFEQDTITLLYGDSGAYKSFLALDIGLHIAARLPWIGQKTTEGPVYYLAGEGHGGIKRRLKAWMDHRFGKPGDWPKVPFYVSPHAIHLDKKNNIKLLLQSIKATAPHPELVIIDTLATSFGSGDENSTKDMTLFLDHAQTIRKALGCSVFIVHHTGHKAKERPRGAYALMAGVDSSYQVEKTDDYLTCLRSASKMKDAVAPRDTWFKARVVDIGIDEDLDNITSLVLSHEKGYLEPEGLKGLGKNQADLYRVVMAQDEIDLTDAKAAFKKKVGSKFNRQAFGNALKTLTERGLVRQQSDGSLSCLRGKSDEE